MIVTINKHVTVAGLKNVLEYHESKIKKGVGELFENAVDFNSIHDTIRIFNSFETYMKATSPRSRHQRYHHIAINFNTADKTNEYDKISIIYVWLKGMKYDQTKHIIYRHSDKDHDHFHVVCSSTLSNGKKIDSYNDHIRSANLSRQIEKAYNLKILNPVGKGEGDFDRYEKYRYAYALTQLTKEELEMSAFTPIRGKDFKNMSNDQIMYAYSKYNPQDIFQTKILAYLKQKGYLKESLKTRIYNAVKGSIDKVQSMDGLLAQIQKSGIYARKVQRKGKWTIQFGDPTLNIYVAGEKVNKDFSFQGLTDMINRNQQYVKNYNRGNRNDFEMGM